MTAAEARPILELYAAGRLSLMRAAERLGNDVSVSEVMVWTYQLGLTPPQPPEASTREELQRALRWFAEADARGQQGPPSE